jgi:DNA-binding transcriptional ArsR family regulator
LLGRRAPHGFTTSLLPGRVALFERYTGIPTSDPIFITASATLGAQSGLSVFVSTAAIVLVLLLQSPHRLFTAWTTVSPDRRRPWLALGLSAVFVAFPLVPTTRHRRPWPRGRERFPSRAADRGIARPSVALALPFVSAYGDGGLGLLGDPMRRAIFETLARRPSSVGDLAEQLPISRPAVSQHLKALKDGGLVVSHAEGTRRIYRLNPQGVDALRNWLDGVWEHALADFHKFAEQAVADDTAGTDHPTKEQP